MLILTGQHPTLDPVAFGLGGHAFVRLDCPGEENPNSHVGRVRAAVLPLLRNSPDLLIVQGDTSSALGGALAGFTAGVAVAHVEAGLRTYDPALPWPEEEYRTAIDARADLLFAPTPLAAANLRREGVPGDIHVTGNTGIDALLAVQANLPPPTLGNRATPRLLVTCHRRESWGMGIRSIAFTLCQLENESLAEIEVILHPNPHVSRTMRHLLGGSPAIRLTDPCTHTELVRRMRDCDLLMSDSGGIQEEAPTLGVPLLVLRDKTERPEGIASGNMRLVGTRADDILREARGLLQNNAARAAMSRRAFPYGDGQAGPRIAELVEQWLTSRRLDERRTG